MFTGLIQTVGTLTLLSADQVQITCSDPSAALPLKDLAIGDSVAVDGICLTVTEIGADGFTADVSPETVRRSTLGQKGDTEKRVNIETSLRVGSKLGGHFVTGHVDGVGIFRSAVQTATSWDITFATQSDVVARYVLPKGSISVNGISLTIAECAPDGAWFTVAVIPHTYATTNLSHLNPEDWVNLEGDILGKYVEKFLGSGQSLAMPDRISPSFLAEHGYL
ncbi:riboflavin synthase [Myxacorys almedinensis]|uniref:Riboflavin synthase n=1 Tax=Myxacorys almedinensis A TaxID=2690445 RepID=A0A8J7Z1J1_9CYAN|nr:riboflavin synthase [Myxacorys almedinensis]NDJ18627.1 riboflavin synthase [Myxacorys almedinensis A]